MGQELVQHSTVSGHCVPAQLPLYRQIYEEEVLDQEEQLWIFYLSHSSTSGTSLFMLSQSIPEDLTRFSGRRCI